MEITRQICKIFKVQIHDLAWSLCKNFPHKQKSYSLGASKKQQLLRQRLSPKTYIVKQGQLLGRNTNTQPKCFKGVRLSVKFPNLRWDEFFDRRKQICLNFYAKNSMNFIHYTSVSQRFNDYFIQTDGYCNQATWKLHVICYKVFCIKSKSNRK